MIPGSSESISLNDTLVRSPFSKHILVQPLIVHYLNKKKESLFKYLLLQSTLYYTFLICLSPFIENNRPICAPASLILSLFFLIIEFF